MQSSGVLGNQMSGKASTQALGQVIPNNSRQSKTAS